MTYQPGDKVRIKPHKLGERCSKKCAYFDEKMEEYIGEIVTLVRKEHLFFGDSWKIKEDKYEWTWSPCMFEPVKKTMSKRCKDCGRYIGEKYWHRCPEDGISRYVANIEVKSFSPSENVKRYLREAEEIWLRRFIGGNPGSEFNYLEIIQIAKLLQKEEGK